MQTKRKTPPKRFTGSSKKKSYGIGGAVMTLGKNLLQGKKFGDGMFGGVLKAGVTPGSGVGAGLGLAGALAGKSKNPALQKLGTGLGMAGNVAGMFTGGGGGGALQGLAGKFAGGGGGAGFQNIMQTLGKGAGGGGMKNILGSLLGNTTAADGMKVYASGGSIPRMKVLKSMEHGGTHDGEDSAAPGYDFSLLPTSVIQNAASGSFEPRVTSGGMTKASDRNTVTTEDARGQGAAAGEEGFQQAQNPSNVGAFNLTTGDGQRFDPTTSSLDSDLSEEQLQNLLSGDFGQKHLSGEGSLDDQYRVYTADVNNYFEEQGPEKMLEEVKQNIANDPEYAKHFKNANEDDFVNIALTKATDKLIGPAHGSLYTMKKSAPMTAGYTSRDYITTVGNPWQKNDGGDGEDPSSNTFIASVGNKAVHPDHIMDLYRIAEANNIDVQKDSPETRDFIESFIKKTGKSILPNEMGAYDGVFKNYGQKIENIRARAMRNGDKSQSRLTMQEFMEMYPDQVFDSNVSYGEPSEGQGLRKEENMSIIKEEQRPAFVEEYFKSKGITNPTLEDRESADSAYEKNPDMFAKVIKDLTPRNMPKFAQGGRVKLMKKGGRSYGGGGALSALMR